MLYFADQRWWEWHREKPDFKSFTGQKATIENTGMLISDPEVFMLHNYNNEGLSQNPNGVHTGSNSGYQAVNIAVLSGAKRVLLLGYEMHFPQGKSHWHAGHPVKDPETNYSMYAKKFNTMIPTLKHLGVEVVNCTPNSRITCFPFVDIAAALG